MNDHSSVDHLACLKWTSVAIRLIKDVLSDYDTLRGALDELSDDLTVIGHSDSVDNLRESCKQLNSHVDAMPHSSWFDFINLLGSVVTPRVFTIGDETAITACDAVGLIAPGLRPISGTLTWPEWEWTRDPTIFDIEKAIKKCRKDVGHFEELLLTLGVNRLGDIEALFYVEESILLAGPAIGPLSEKEWKGILKCSLRTIHNWEKKGQLIHASHSSKGQIIYQAWSPALRERAEEIRAAIGNRKNNRQ